MQGMAANQQLAKELEKGCKTIGDIEDRLKELSKDTLLYVKIAVTDCPNDCIKAHMQDIGVIGMVLTVYDAGRFIGCGECILKCPASAWTRGDRYFRLVIMGRTGKKNPRLARTLWNGSAKRLSLR